MNPAIKINGVHKTFGGLHALKGIDLTIEQGEFFALLGPNGAGKTTLLKGIVGLARVEGNLDVLGMNPFSERVKLLHDVSFIADTAILPSWIKVSQALDYVAGVHPKFNREKALGFLAKTDINLKSKVKELSKGMITQLHLAQIFAQFFVHQQLQGVTNSAFGGKLLALKALLNRIGGVCQSPCRHGEDRAADFLATKQIAHRLNGGGLVGQVRFKVEFHFFFLRWVGSAAACCGKVLLASISAVI